MLLPVLGEPQLSRHVWFWICVINRIKGAKYFRIAPSNHGWDDWRNGCGLCFASLSELFWLKALRTSPRYVTTIVGTSSAVALLCRRSQVQEPIDENTFPVCAGGWHGRNSCRKLFSRRLRQGGVAGIHVATFFSDGACVHELNFRNRDEFSTLSYAGHLNNTPPSEAHSARTRVCWAHRLHVRGAFAVACSRAKHVRGAFE